MKLIGIVSVCLRISEGQTEGKMLLHMLLILPLGAVNCAKILFFTYVPSVSHQYVFRSIWKELSLRGHEVFAIATDPLHDSNLTNLTEIDVSVGYKTFGKFDYSNLSGQNVGVFETTDAFLGSFEYALDLEIQTEAFQSLLKKPEDYFDLIIVETHNPTAFGIQNKFTAPVIGISSLGAANILYEFLGSPVHPILYPEISVEQDVIDFKLSLPQKFYRLYIALGLWFKYNFQYFKHGEVNARKYFGKGKRSLVDMIRNLDLLLVNINPIFSNRRPNAANIIEYYNVHQGRQVSLKNDLQKVLDNAKEGAIYFSLGTNVRFDHVQGNIKQAILEALGELPYTVLCKWESEDFPGKPKNVILRKWFPQQAILAHPNVKIFVTQGGLQSSEEAIANAVPLVIIPFLGDQPMNAKILTKHGMAETIPPKLLEKNILRDTILKVIGDEKYRRRAQELRSIFLDQPMSGIDKIIWWCEYVIRHKGAKHLRSPSADIPLYEYFMLDVFAVIFTALFVIYKIVSLAVRFLVRLLRGQKKKKETKKKTN